MPYAKNDDLEIYFECFGEGPPLILIMGLGADSMVWELHRDFYKEKFQCIAIDNRGVGKSSKPKGPYTSREMASDVVAVMDELNILKASVAGISMGGVIAQSLTLDWPDRVSSLVLISSWAQCDAYTKTVFQNFKVNRAYTSSARFMECLQLWIFATKFFEENEKDLIEARIQADANEAPQPQYAFEAQCDACINHDSLERLSEIKVPTLITVGDKDIFTPLAFSRVLHEKIEEAEIIVYPDTGHAHHWEVLDQFNNDSRNFLLSHEGAQYDSAQ